MMKGKPQYFAIVIWVGAYNIITSNSARQMSLQELLDSWTFLDGSPCGVLEK